MAPMSPRLVTEAPVGSWMDPLRVPPESSHLAGPSPALIRVLCFLLSSPDLPQLPTPHVHSTPGPSQPISHASMASAPSFTPALIQGTVSSFSLSLPTCCSPARLEKLHRRTVAPPWLGDSPARCQPGSSPSMCVDFGVFQEELWAPRAAPRAALVLCVLVTCCPSVLLPRLCLPHLVLSKCGSVPTLS